MALEQFRVSQLHASAELRADADSTSASYCTVVVPKSQSKPHINSVNSQAAAAVAAFVANGNNPPAGYYVVGDGPVVGPKQ
ncbi:MAG TPA: hypothetical protein VGW36_10250 [Pyrinomonadaceae bacterium]|nr:hypothetical protein [Pyrinomonadaceae bacterium]